MVVRSLLGSVVMVLSVGVGTAGAQAPVPWSPTPAIPPALPTTVVQAQAQPAAASGGSIVSEVKLGALYHDLPFLGTHKEKGADIDAEVLFTSPAFLKRVWAPRPHLGVSINTSGYTSQAYAGLTWSWTLASNVISQGDGLFAGFSLGGGGNNGKIKSNKLDRKSVGSHVLFRESVEAGYQFNSPFSISIYSDHISNAGIAKKNQGETNAGMRVGYRF